MARKPIRVLLIEDNPGDAGLIRRMLNASDEPRFDLRHATGLQDGVKQLRSEPPDLLLLDLELPGSSGLETLTTAKSASDDVPIIVLTGIDETQTILQCIKSGARNYFVKSRIDREKLIEAILREL